MADRFMDAARQSETGATQAAATRFEVDTG
jgi:hypothetical protein